MTGVTSRLRISDAASSLLVPFNDLRGHGPVPCGFGVKGRPPEAFSAPYWFPEQVFVSTIPAPVPRLRASNWELRAFNGLCIVLL